MGTDGSSVLSLMTESKPLVKWNGHLPGVPLVLPVLIENTLFSDYYFMLLFHFLKPLNSRLSSHTTEKKKVKKEEEEKKSAFRIARGVLQVQIVP